MGKNISFHVELKLRNQSKPFYRNFLLTETVRAHAWLKLICIEHIWYKLLNKIISIGTAISNKTWSLIECSHKNNWQKEHPPAQKGLFLHHLNAFCDAITDDSTLRHESLADKNSLECFTFSRWHFMNYYCYACRRYQFSTILTDCWWMLALALDLIQRSSLCAYKCLSCAQKRSSARHSICADWRIHITLIVWCGEAKNTRLDVQIANSWIKIYLLYIKRLWITWNYPRSLGLQHFKIYLKDR